MEQIEVYILLLGIITLVGVLFQKISAPTTLFLVITGMLLTLIPDFPHIHLEANIVLHFFLPLLLYETSTLYPWREVRVNIRPIALLSVGHVLFITLLVAVVAHYLIPELNWPMAFVLGAVVAPPDDLAIVAIAEKNFLPRRLINILLGEAMLNDATALTLFRFALIALITQQFSPLHAMVNFWALVIGETLYGIALGYFIGKLRMRVYEPRLQIMISFLTPFLAYFPAQYLGGSGILSTVVTGLIIGHYYMDRFPPEVRLLGNSVWSTLGFLVQSFLFLLVGLDFRLITERISSIPVNNLILYAGIVIAVIIVGRFIWVYPAAYLPRLLFPSLRQSEPKPPWQYPLLVSWSGMRGGVSLAAALAVPVLPTIALGVNPRDLVVFLVFCVIIVTLILQGLALPWVVKITGLHRQRQKETHEEYLAELYARIEMYKDASRWLHNYKKIVQEDEKLYEEVKFHLRQYKNLRQQCKDMLKQQTDQAFASEEAELHESLFLSSQVIEVEREALKRLWRNSKIDLVVRNKLLQQLDLRSKHLTG